MPNDKIGDFYDWETLHHMHCIVRYFVNGAHLEKEVFGSLGAFAAKSDHPGDEFDYGDVYDAQTMLGSAMLPWSPPSMMRAPRSTVRCQDLSALKVPCLGFRSGK